MREALSDEELGGERRQWEIKHLSPSTVLIDEEREKKRLALLKLQEHISPSTKVYNILN